MAVGVRLRLGSNEAGHIKDRSLGRFLPGRFTLG